DDGSDANDNSGENDDNSDDGFDDGAQADEGCFAAGTEVLTPAGSCPIDQLAPGDLVLAFDERAGVIVPRSVRKAHVHHSRQVMGVRFEDGTQLTATRVHRFHTGGRWQALGGLAAGERVSAIARDKNGLTETSLVSMTPLDEPTTVY